MAPTGRLAFGRRPHQALTVIAVILALVWPGLGAGQNATETLPGLTTGALMPERHWRLTFGSAQTPHRDGEGQTGRQVYMSQLSYRHDGPWQITLSASGFDDLPAQSLAGRADDVTDIALGAALKYGIPSGGRWQNAVLAGAEARYFSRGQRLLHQAAVAKTDRDMVLAATLGWAATYQATKRLWAMLGAGYTHAPAMMADQTGFGPRGFAELGLAFQPTQRWHLYGGLKALMRPAGSGLDAPLTHDDDLLYTLGTGWALTAESVLDVYVTNSFASTPIGDDLRFYPDKSQAALGVALRYTPSRGDRTARPDPGGDDGQAWPVLGAGKAAIGLAMGTEGAAQLTLRLAPDPDLQFSLSAQDLALDDHTGFRDEQKEDIRLSFGTAWQALRQGRDAAFDLGVGVTLSRDLADPSIGVVLGEAHLERDFGPAELGLTARHALYGPDFGDKPEALRRSGLSLSAAIDLTDKTALFGSFGAVRDHNAVWSAGLRHRLPHPGLTLDIRASNAAGQIGIGPLLARQNARVMLGIDWRY